MEKVASAGLATTVLNTARSCPQRGDEPIRNRVLNLDAINCLRSFAGTGTVVWGARTLAGWPTNQAFAQSMYVPVRRA